MEQIDYQKQLDEYLMKKLKEQNNPSYGAADRAEMGRIEQNNSDNALASSLMKSAAQMGSIGGKVADTSAVDTMAQGLGKTNQLKLGQIEDRRAREDKQFGMNADVYKYLAEKQRKAEELSATKDSRAKTLAQNAALAAQKRADEERRFGIEQGNKNRDFGLKEKELAAKEAAEKTKLAEKTTNPKAEVELGTRVNNIQANIDKLKGIIDKTGTFELLGPESDTMDQVIQDIAVDYAKMVDPESVARESEVDSAKKMLNVKGLFTRNNTAKSSLDEFRDQLETRINSRRTAQGLEPIAKTKKPTYGDTAIADDKASKKTPEDDAALNWARSNPTDPRAKEILRLNGGQ
jgi:hypothetical protein